MITSLNLFPMTVGMIFAFGIPNLACAWEFVPSSQSNEDENGLVCYASVLAEDGQSLSIGLDYIGNFRLEMSGPIYPRMNYGINATEMPMAIRIFDGPGSVLHENRGYWNYGMDAISLNLDGELALLRSLMTGDRAQITVWAESSHSSDVSLVGSSDAIGRALTCP